MFVVEDAPKSMVAESYKALRTNLQYSSFDSNNKVIVITSSKEGEGKSTVAGNLSLALAQDEKNVIIVDCDLRRPSLHKKFFISNIKGLSDIIVNNEDIDNVLNQYNDNLSIITSGKIPPNPSEMIGSKAMKYLIQTLKKSFDYVILDTPPVIAVTDAQILSNIADGVLLVIKAGSTKKQSVTNAISALKKVNANILGMVLNMANITKDSYYYGNEKHQYLK